MKAIKSTLTLYGQTKGKLSLLHAVRRNTKYKYTVSKGAFNFSRWCNKLELRSVRPSVRSSTKCFFSDLDLISCVCRPRSDMRTSMTTTRTKVKIKVTELLKFRKLHFSRSISCAVLSCSSKLMVDYDSMGPSLQLVGYRFLNFLLSKLSRDFKLRGMSILHDFQRAIFPYCLRL